MKRPAPVVSLLWRQSAVAASRLHQLRVLQRRLDQSEQQLAAMTRQRDRARDDVELVLRMVPDKQFALDLLQTAHQIAAEPEVRR